MPLTPEEAEKALSSAGSDLRWLMADNGVDEALQAAIYHGGFTKVRLFVGLAESRAELRDVLRGDFGVDAQANLESRQRAAVVLAAWGAAKEFVSARGGPHLSRASARLGGGAHGHEVGL